MRAWLTTLVAFCVFVVACGPSSPRAPSNVLLITIDTLRADHLGVYGAETRTPELDALARGGVVFSRAYAHSPLTLPSHSSIFTGDYPTRHGVRDNGRYRLDDHAETLAERLRAAGYRTGAFVGAFPVDARFGLAQGFDVYDDDFGSKASPVSLAERRAEDVARAARAWITSESSQPFFAWVHFFDPHAPYAPPSPRDASYAGEVQYVDGVVGELLRVIDEDTLVVVTADHGEGLGEHGEQTHSLFVYDSTLHVPLIFRAPGVAPGLVVDDLARSVDVLPTILDLVGLDPCTDCDGESLVPSMRGEHQAARVSYGETYFAFLNLGWSPLRSLHEDGWKYIDAPVPELYDLVNDPGETKNLANDVSVSTRERLASMKEALSRFPAEESLETPAVDVEAVSMLRRLGYLSASEPVTNQGSLADPKSRLEVWERVKSGIELIGRGRPEDAIEALSRASAREPELILARSYLATAYFEVGRYAEAASESSAVLERAPNDYDATLLLGRALARSPERQTDARAFLERAAELDPAAASPWVELAQLALASGSVAEARALTAEAAKRDRRSPRVLVMNGKLAALDGDAATAEGLFREALSQAPFDEEARLQLGNLLLGQRRLEEAGRLFEEGLERRPRSALLLVGLGNRYAIEGNLSRALPLFERAVQLDSSSPIVLNSLGFAYLQGPDPARGRALLEKSLNLSPRQPELAKLLESLEKK